MQLFRQATSSFTKTEWKTRDRKPKHVVMMIMPFSSRDRNGGHLNRWPPLPLLHYFTDLLRSAATSTPAGNRTASSARVDPSLLASL